MNYTVSKIGPCAYQIIEENKTTNVYMYLIVGSERALLIDTGYGTIPLDRIVAELTELPVDVVLTHGHFDHIGAAGAFANVSIHEKDLPLYRSHSKMGDPAGSRSLYPVREEIGLFGDDKTFDLGDRIIEVIPVPGHSLGCICLYDPEENLLYTGDTCCVGDVLLNLENAGTPEQYLESVRRLQVFVRAHKIEHTWPGHHVCPVDNSIIDEFEEATKKLIHGDLKPETLDTPFGQAKHVSYKRIGIWLDSSCKY